MRLGFEHQDKDHVKMFLCGTCLHVAVLIASSALLVFNLWFSGNAPFVPENDSDTKAFILLT